MAEFRVVLDCRIVAERVTAAEAETAGRDVLRVAEAVLFQMNLALADARVTDIYRIDREPDGDGDA